MFNALQDYASTSGDEDLQAEVDRIGRLGSDSEIATETAELMKQAINALSPNQLRELLYGKKESISIESKLLSDLFNDELAKNQSHKHLLGELSQFGIKTVYDISKYCPKSIFSKIDRVGGKTIAVVEEALKRENLTFAEELSLYEEHRLYPLKALLGIYSVDRRMILVCGSLGIGSLKELSKITLKEFIFSSEQSYLASPISENSYREDEQKEFVDAMLYSVSEYMDRFKINFKAEDEEA